MSKNEAKKAALDKALMKYAENKDAYSGKTAHPFQRNGAPFRLKLSKAQLVN